MIREVLQRGDPILERACEPVEDIGSCRDVIADLRDTIRFLKTTHEFKRGIGLAAPQIGKPFRISIVESAEGKEYVLLNPKIVKDSGVRNPIREGCISFFGYRAMVPRLTYVKVEAMDEKGRRYHVEGHDDFAMLLEHELDHLDGILYISRLKDGEKDLIKVD